MDTLAEQIIVNILTSEMCLPKQNCWVRDQNRLFPGTPGLFAIVGMVDSQVVSNINSFNGSTLAETQDVQTIDKIQIDILSRDTTAIFRRWEVLAALKSIYSEQQQENNTFKIYQIPTSFINTSYAEGGSEINRFSIVIPCQVWYRKVKPISSIYGDYFDEFSVRVDDENSIGTPNGIIEFTEP
jgi:hypothetical protein